MEVQALIEPLELAIVDTELTQELAALANCLSSNKPCPQLPNHILEKAISLKLLSQEAPVRFTSAGIQALFYAIQYAGEKIKTESSDEEIVEFLSRIDKRSFPTFYSNNWYQVREIIYLILNRVHGHDLPRLIAERKLYSRSIFHAYWDLLPYLKSSSINLVKALFLSTLDITAEGNYINLNQAVRKCASANTEFAKELLEACQANKHDLDLFFMHTFLGYSQAVGIKTAYPYLDKMLTSPNKDFVITGLKSYAWLHGFKDQPQEIKKEITPILDDLETRNDDQLTSHIILVYGLLIDKLEGARGKLLSLISEDLGPDSRFMLSHIVQLNMKSASSEQWFTTALNLLTNLRGQHIGTYVNLSSAFAYAFGTPPELFYSFIDKFIETEENEIKTLEGFRNVFERAITKDKAQFEKWLTLALNNDNRRFHQAVREVLLIIGKTTNELQLSQEVMTDLTPFDVEFILFKIVGNIYSKEHLQSMTYSALEYVDGTGLVPQIVTELLSLYILYNYPGTINYLRGKKDTANTVQASVIKVVEQHYNETHRIKEVKPPELAPSSTSLQKLFRKFSDQIRDFKDESPFRQPRIIDYVTHITIVKGNSFFHRDGNYGALKEKYKSKSEMGKIAVEFEMPGGEFVDPIGQEYNRHYWRTVKRRKQ